ncbi:MAG: alanine--tRNA ligase, partial [Phycisphaerales bacterium]|nr:alanine--tRNA ligase [Phycisphaerales bacterium]
WEMGDTGPCGPCSELHYDRIGNRDAAALVNADDPMVIEIWNLVFIQFDRQPDGLRPLPARHVDTGMGLERITRVIQGKTSNYDTDAFTTLFQRIREVCSAPAYTGTLEKPEDIAYRVIADHARTLTFAITDGAEPSNDGRGYVLRRILRRAVRYGRQTLGVDGAFLHQLVPTVVDTMGDAFPELRRDPERVIRIIHDEEDAFGRTLKQGLALFDKAATTATLRQPASISADDAFMLHDTYGFPIDLTTLMAQERGLTVDTAGFESRMEGARRRSREAGKASGAAAMALGGEGIADLHKLGIRPTDDLDKFHGRRITARVVAIWNGTDFDEHILASHTRPTDRFGVILDKTNFYAEMGGQVADTGRISVTRDRRASVQDGHDGGDFLVEDAHNCGGYVLHVGRIRKGEIRVGDTVEVRLDGKRRSEIAANHTATHLLNHALRQLVGDHVDQKGSLVTPERLRFDFSHTAPLTPDQLDSLQEHVSDAIARDLEVFASVAPVAQAKQINGLRAVFGETYPDPVRVVSIGAPVDQLLAQPGSDQWRENSIEFCGGTHLTRTGEARAFALIGEESVSAGVRRLHALTRQAAGEAHDYATALQNRIAAAATLDDTRLPDEARTIQELLDTAEIPLAHKARLRALLERLNERVKGLRKQAAKAGRDTAVDAAREVASSASGPVIVAPIPAGSDRNALMAALDAIRAKHADAAIMLISADEEEGKVSIVANVPEALVSAGLKAGDWVREISAICGGKGGGRPDAAQGGGTDPSRVGEALDKARAFAAGKL